MFTRITRSLLFRCYPLHQHQLISHSIIEQIIPHQTTLETTMETITPPRIAMFILILNQRGINQHRALHLSLIKTNLDTIKTIRNQIEISSLLILKTIIRRNRRRIRITPLMISTLLCPQRTLLTHPVNHYPQIRLKRSFLRSCAIDVISLDMRLRPVQVSRTGVIARWCCLRK